MREKIVLRISGEVQGVGFRPFVARMAREHGVGGTVRNEGGQVLIDAFGSRPALKRFVQSLQERAPAASRIARLEKRLEILPPDSPFPQTFSILHSRDAEGTIYPTPDIALCDDCLRELFTPDDPRYQNPFVSCAHCGPRYTILRRTPYDRQNTAMDRFAMCSLCASQYGDPADRRCHAQTVCCNRCGPVLLWRGTNGREASGAEALAEAAQALMSRQVVMVKGIGGFHLACDALSDEPVATLRALKGREHKPFAVMFASLNALEAHCAVSPEERALLTGPERPIMLLRRRPDSPVATGVSGTSPCLGAFLPYTPLQHLLLAKTGPLVMTSANRSGLPLLRENGEALRFAAEGCGCAGVLYHDRDILRRLDDSVAAVVAGGVQMIRRARGYVPRAIPWKRADTPAVLAYGAQQKSAVCLSKGCNLFPSAEIGDLENLETLGLYQETIGDLQTLLDIRPELGVCDLHPGYESTRAAEQGGLPLIRVQHHFAHIASVMAETGITEPLIGVAFDGTGYGLDGTVWGGEFLLASPGGFTRAGHLKPIRYTGSDESVRQCWKSAACVLYDAGILPADAGPRYAALKAALDADFHTVRSSSMGRLFDAASALLGFCQLSTYEGQGAIELENAAAGADANAAEGQVPLPMALCEQATGIVADPAPCIRQLVSELKGGADPRVLALRFHRTVSRMIADVCDRLRTRYAVGTVALSGGVFQNRILLEDTLRNLEQRGFRVEINRIVPPGDGGLALGQAYVGRWIGWKREELRQCALPLRES